MEKRVKLATASVILITTVLGLIGYLFGEKQNKQSANEISGQDITNVVGQGNNTVTGENNVLIVNDDERPRRIRDAKNLKLIIRSSCDELRNYILYTEEKMDYQTVQRIGNDLRSTKTEFVSLFGLEEYKAFESAFIQLEKPILDFVAASYGADYLTREAAMASDLSIQPSPSEKEIRDNALLKWKEQRNRSRQIIVPKLDSACDRVAGLQLIEDN